VKFKLLAVFFALFSIHYFLMKLFKWHSTASCCFHIKSLKYTTSCNVKLYHFFWSLLSKWHGYLKFYFYLLIFYIETELKAECLEEYFLLWICLLYAFHSSTSKIVLYVFHLGRRKCFLKIKGFFLKCKLDVLFCNLAEWIQGKV